jgi:DNA-binding transcriptional LysR family regulator
LARGASRPVEEVRLLVKAPSDVLEISISKLGIAPHVVMQTPHSNMACAYAAAGAGITLVSHWAAQSFSGPNVVVDLARLVIIN